MGRRLGFRESSDGVGIDRPLHDVGKSAFPIEVLNKPGALDEKMGAHKKHPMAGVETVLNLDAWRNQSKNGDRIFDHHLK